MQTLDTGFDAVLIAFAITLAAGLFTILGALSVVFARRPDPRLLAFALAFAGGAMVYVSFVEITVKAQTAFAAVYDPKTAYSLATLAFFLGVLLLAGVDRLVANPHAGLSRTDGTGDRAAIARLGILAALAIGAHNLPEGLATFLATLDDPAIGLPLAAAIAIHNIPEGVSIAVPVYFATQSKAKAIGATAIAALAEPVGAAIGFAILGPFLHDAVFGWVFGIIAGVMVFLALDELLPAARRYAKGHETVYGMVLGMAALALSLVLFK
ncbi:MAG: zinc transporter ZupT [Labrys sp. (in: a-proteobacteria)]